MSLGACVCVCEGGRGGGLEVKDISLQIATFLTTSEILQMFM